MVEYTMTLKTQIQSLPGKYSTWLLNEMLSLLLENNNDHNQVFWARETQHLQQTIVLTKTAGQQPWFWSLLFKVFPSLVASLVPRVRFSFGQHQERALWPLQTYAQS